MQFRAAGHEIVASPDQAEMAVVNTCAVTNDAAADFARHASAALPAPVSGRSSPRAAGPRCSPGKPQLCPMCSGLYQTAKRITSSPKPYPLTLLPLTPCHPAFDLEPLSRQPLPGLHRRTRAFIKVQDGCDNHCTFCVTTVAARRRTQPPAGGCICSIFNLR